MSMLSPPRHFRWVIVLLLVVLRAPGAQAATEGPGDLYLAHANIVDPDSRHVRQGNLLILKGVVVGTPEKPPAGFTGTTLDLQGKWIIPGLVDLHVHTFGNVDASGKPVDVPGTAGIAQRMLYAGVTSFVDLFGHEEMLFQLREQQRAGKLGGADIFASLSCITATGAHGTEYGVPARIADSPEQARRAVVDLELKRPDVIKIIYEAGTGRPSIDKATLIAAVGAARASGLKTIVHISNWQNARDAVEAGATAITHVPAEPMPKDLARLMAGQNVASIPTLALIDSAHFITQPEVLDNPMARALTTGTLIDTFRSPDLIKRLTERRSEIDVRIAEILRSVKTMADAGVAILAGTDSGAVGTLHGYSAHRELTRMVDSGLSPWQALAAATTEAGRFLERPYGVRAGSEANLVVLEDSPIADIRNTQRIAYVIHHGVVVDRQKAITSEAAGLRR